MAQPGELLQNQDGAVNYTTVPNGETGYVPTQLADGSKAMQSSRSPGSGVWRFASATTPPPPPGRIQLNQADQPTSTVLYLSTTDVDGSDLANFLEQVQVGDGLYLQQQDDSSAWQFWGIDTVTNQSGYKEYAITLLDSSPSPSLTNNSKIIVSIRPGAVVTESLRSNDSNARSATPTLYEPISTDIALIYDKTAKELKTSSLAGITAAVRVFAFIRGALTQAFTTSSSYQSLPLWNVDDADHIYSSTDNISIGNSKDISVSIPLRYRLLFVGSMTAFSNADFDFAFLVDGVAFPLQKDTSRSGDGVGNTVSFTMEGVTPLLAPGPHTISIGAKNAGDDILSLSGSLSIEFAGED